jgi:hypothetical protein
MTLRHIFFENEFDFLQKKKLNKIENKLFEKNRINSYKTGIAPLSLNRAQCYKTLQPILLLASKARSLPKVEELKVALLR